MQHIAAIAYYYFVWQKADLEELFQSQNIKEN